MGKIADISKWQGNVDWSKASGELDFAILRASCGQDILDTKYLRNVEGCIKYGVPFGAYHYVKAGTYAEARKEAAFFLSCIEKGGRKPCFYIADIEYSTQTSKTTEAVCVAFLEELRKAGCPKIGMYINTRYKWAGKAIQMCDIMWIPHWGKNTGEVPEDKYKSSNPHDLWQYTSNGKLAGVSGRVDLNALTGTKALAYFTQQDNDGKTETREMTNMFTNKNLVAFALKAYADKWRYWYGTCGYKCTKDLYDRKKKQYPSHYTSSRESGYKADIKANAMCADCVGLIKAFFWLGGNVDGSNKYASNGCPDRSADGLFSLCKETGAISTIPDIPGLVVWKSGHIGIYVGNGYTIEMRGFAYDCVKRKVSDGPWTKWGKLPSSMLVYEDDATVETQEYELGERTLKKGCEGNDVKEMQEILMQLGYALPKYGADGDFGTETKGAVTAFQKNVGMDATGIFDENTYKALLDELNGNDDSDADTPDGGSEPVYKLTIRGEKAELEMIQEQYGGTLTPLADAKDAPEIGAK